jgi:hypothetical protein
MATGIQMLEAVREAIRQRPGIVELPLSTFDVIDLEKLKPSDLQEKLGLDLQRAEGISSDLFKGSLVELSNCLGVKLLKDRQQKNLIPGEGFRRSAGIWNVDGEELNLDAIVDEIRQLRHPEAH